MFLNIVWLGKCVHKCRHQAQYRRCFGSPRPLGNSIGQDGARNANVLERSGMAVLMVIPKCNGCFSHSMYDSESVLYRMF